jgi:hypothetical protein
VLLRNALAVELNHLLDEVVVVKDYRTGSPGGKRMLVARRRHARVDRGYRTPLLIVLVHASLFFPWTSPDLPN